MNESGQYHWESETFRNKYEAVLYYVRAVLDNIMKQPNCTKIIRDKCLNTVDIIDTLLLDYNKWYNNSYGNWGNKKEEGRNFTTSHNLGIPSSNGQSSFNNHGITSQFGTRVHPISGKVKEHQGIDLNYVNEDVGAFAGGTVTYAGWMSGYGNTIKIQDKLGAEHLYGHLSNIGVSKGQEIAKGQIIGISGSTGDSTGPHLHYGVSNNGRWVDPIAYVSALDPSSDRNKIQKKEDEYAQKVIKYWNTRGQDKGGFWHENAFAYKRLADKYKEEYAKSVIDPSKYMWGSLGNPYKEALKEARDSQEAKDYANKKITEYVASKSAEAQAVSYSNSLRIKNGDIEKPDEVPGASEAFQQWDVIKKSKGQKVEDEPAVTLGADRNQIKIDITGTELCSNVLRNTLNAQQQIFRQC